MSLICMVVTYLSGVSTTPLFLPLFSLLMLLVGNLVALVGHVFCISMVVRALFGCIIVVTLPVIMSYPLLPFAACCTLSHLFPHQLPLIMLTPALAPSFMSSNWFHLLPPLLSLVLVMVLGRVLVQHAQFWEWPLSWLLALNVLGRVLLWALGRVLLWALGRVLVQVLGQFLLLA